MPASTPLRIPTDWWRPATRSTRQGYAREALRLLLERAERDPAIRTVRLSIGPDNVPSTALASHFAFEKVGEQWDEEDGLEIRWERAARILH